MKTVFFKNNEIYNKAKVGFYIQAHIEPDRVMVLIDDLSKQSWQLPLDGVRPFTNPKIKEYTTEEFNKHFYIP